MDITIRRGNVLLTVPDFQKDEYKAKGFDVIENGRVVERAIPHDLASFKKAYTELTTEIKRLKQENTSLKEDLKTALKEVTPSKTIKKTAKNS